MSIAFLIVRLILGLGMTAHGTQKLFGWFGGPGIAGTSGAFEGLGFRPGTAFALTAGLGETIGGLLTVEQCLPGIDADRTRRGDALDGVGKTVGQGRRHRRKYARLIGILLADRSRGRERRAITGERLRYAFIILAHDGALSVELRIALVSARQRRLDGLCGDLARQGPKA